MTLQLFDLFPKEGTKVPEKALPLTVLSNALMANANGHLLEEQFVLVE